MRHPFFFEPRHSSLLAQLEAFRADVVDPLLEQEVDDRACTVAAVRALGDAGLLKLTVPAAFGGAAEALDSRSLCLARETLAYASALVDTAFAMQGLGSYPLTLAGSEALKARYLPGVGRGELIAAFAITEPDAGSDVASMGSTAARVGDQYVLNGTKRFISNAGLAHFYCFFARTGDAGHRGLSAFLLPATCPGLRVEPITLMAPHPIGELHLDECHIPVSHRLGEEGQGFQIAMQTLDRFRPTVGAAALGMGQRALHEALHYSSSRVQFGVPLSEHQLTRLKLAELATELEAARLLVYQAAWIKDQGADRVTREAAMAKLYATEAAQRAIDSALQLHGGNGVVQGFAVERLYREIRALRIYEGTSEVQHLVIAADLLKTFARRAAG